MVLVTGGAGYIGSVLVRKLLEIGEEVRVLDKLYFGDEGLEGVRHRIELIEGDIRDFDPTILDGIDSIIHLAALSTDPQAEFNPEATLKINTESTEKLAKAAKERGIKRFIFASSCSVYYSPISDMFDEPKSEETPVAPRAPYSRSKWLAEQKLLKLMDKNFCPVILRKGTVFGYSPRFRADLVVNTFVKDAFSKGRLTVNAGGEMFRPLVHIDDVTHAYITCLLAPEDKVKGQVFNLVHKNYFILALAHWVRHILENKKEINIDVHYHGQNNARSYYVQGDKINKILGLKPEVGITKGVHDLWEIFKKGEHNDFDSPKYNNIKQMEELIKKGKIDKNLY